MASRRTALIVIGLSCLPAGTAFTRTRGKPWRIGYLFLGSRELAAQTNRYEPLIDGLRDLGYVEGRDFIIDARYADGDPRRFAGMAAALLQSAPDVIVATGSPLYPLLKKANRATPIVVTVAPDPVAEGLAQSLPRPGGYFTGLTTSAPETSLKQVELLKTLLPSLSYYGVLFNPIGGYHRKQVENHRALARSMKLTLVDAGANTPSGLDDAFGVLKAGQAQGVIILGDTFFLQQRSQIAILAQNSRLPAISNVREFTAAGCLLSYGLDVPSNVRRAADFVHRIMHGAHPGDLPFEQPTKFDLTVNLRTAAILGLQMPKSLLALADRVFD